MVEYNFKDVYKTFDISYFSKNDDLVSKKFADSEKLKNYESIEKFNNKLIIVLIKKFKLKLTFVKNSNFSNHVLISDVPDFDPTKFPHMDDVLKIALIKNEFDQWINSDLSNYDYIFTVDEYYDDLKKQYKCFKFNGETVYEQIKNVLNISYRRKLEKFHYFMKNINFENVFPKEMDYFKVLNSDYFDDDWYRATYKITDNTDSVIHFLLVGHNKGNNPGPDFSTSEYYECNKDVEIDGMNPLVHYELYGRKENRIIKTSEIGKRNYNLILNSSYFDEEWYKNTYLFNEDIDFADHYLNEGYLKSYNPGPDFNTFEYLKANEDVRKVGINPLVHYELYGKKENRKIELPEEIKEMYYSTILNSDYFDEEWYRDTYEINEDCANHYLNIGFVNHFNPGPNFSTDDYYESNEDVKDFGMNPLLHYELYGKKEGRCINLTDLIKRDYSLISNSPYFDDEWYGRTYCLNDNIDFVEHYMNEGYLKGYNPGPDFSTFEYYECNKEVKEWKMNPLVHYEFYGRKEKRTKNLPYDKIQSYRSSILNSDFFDKDWYKTTYDLSDDIDPIDHYCKIGFTLGYNPGPDFSTSEYYECNPDVEEYGLNPLVHYELYGRNEGRKLKKSDLMD